MNQVAISFVINFSIWGACASHTMSAVVLPQLSDPNNDDLYMNKEQGSWFGKYKERLSGDIYTALIISNIGKNLIRRFPL